MGSWVDSFCVLPWVHTHLDLVRGTVKLCCDAEKESGVDSGVPDLNCSSLEMVYNSAYMRGIRKMMLNGQWPGGCSACSRREQAIGDSLRIRANKAWLPLLGVDKESIAMHGMSTDYSAYAPLAYLRINIGRECNLMCRMCSESRSSSYGDGPAAVQEKSAALDAAARSREKWKELVLGEMVSRGREIHRIHFTGGEPLIIPLLVEILSSLTASGVSRQIELTFNTNLTVVPGGLLEQLSQFKKVSLFASIDGIGSVYEYIRYPAVWAQVEKNIVQMMAAEACHLSIAPLVQAYNLHNICDFCSYFDALGLNFTFNVIRGPSWLRLGVLPRNYRETERERLLDYASQLPDSFTHSRKQIETLCKMIELTKDEPDEVIARFIHKTEEMDRARNQSLSDSAPYLYGLFHGMAVNP